MKRTKSEETKRPSQIKMFGYTILYAIGLVGNMMSRDVKLLVAGLALAGFITVGIGLSTTGAPAFKVRTVDENDVANTNTETHLTINHDGILGMEFASADAADYATDETSMQEQDAINGSTVNWEPVVQEVAEPAQEAELVIADENTDTSGLEYLGRFIITHYCVENYPHICNDGDPSQTASGEPPVPYHTCAVDTSQIPMLSTIVINGNEYRCNDRGGAILGNRIDLCVDTHDNALAFGKYEADVYIKR